VTVSFGSFSGGPSNFGIVTGNLATLTINPSANTISYTGYILSPGPTDFETYLHLPDKYRVDAEYVFGTTAIAGFSVATLGGFDYFFGGVAFGGALTGGATAVGPGAGLIAAAAPAATGLAAGFNGDFSPASGGTVFTHFTDAAGLEGITGVSANSLVSGERATVGRITFGTGSNSFLASNAGDIFVTDLSADASAGQLNQIGVFGAKQSYAIQFSQEAALNNGIRPALQKGGVFTIPGGSTLQGTITIIAR